MVLFSMSMIKLASLSVVLWLAWIEHGKLCLYLVWIS